MSMNRCIAVILSVILSYNAHGETAKIKWQKISSDLEVATYNPKIDSIFSQEIIFLRTALSGFNAAVLSDKDNKSRTVKDFCRDSNSSICINANFFDENKKALGLVIKEGQTVNPLHKGGSLLNAIFSIEKNKIKITPRKYFDNFNSSYAVQSGPMLMQNGKVYSKFKSGDIESRRAGACIDYQGKLVLFCSLGEVTGPSFNKLVTILSMPGIACKDAINFDGGGSAQLYINEKFVNIKKFKPDNKLENEDVNIGDVEGKYSVPVAFVLKSK